MPNSINGAGPTIAPSSLPLLIAIEAWLIGISTGTIPNPAKAAPSIGLLARIRCRDEWGIPLPLLGRASDLIE